MQRRNFLKIASTLSSVIPAWALTPAAFAQTAASYTGKLLITVQANGGLDQGSFVDPRETDRAMNAYAGVRPANLSGNIRSAPMASNKAFFDMYYRQMLVINGVHSETNNHGDGERAHATGRLDMGYATAAELFANQNGRRLPMPWLNESAYGTSAGLVAASAVPNEAVWNTMARPNYASTTRDYMKGGDIDRVEAATVERLNALQARGDMLPRTKQITDQFLAASAARGLLARVSQFTPPANSTFAKAYIALLAGQAGITSSIQLGTPSRFGFDGHSDLVNRYNTRLPELTSLVQYVWDTAATLGIADRIFLRIASEFGRSPTINSGNGKDHWAVGSTIFMEANPRWGNRVFGASGKRMEALKFTTAGVLDPAGGKVMYPRHIHAAMRDYLGFNTTDPRFDLKVPAGERFDFFNPANNTGYPNI